MPEADIAVVYPIFLKLAGRAVVVVGAGDVAARKIAVLVDAGARVRVVAPQAVDVVRQLAADGRVEWVTRRYAGGDAQGAWLIVAATSDARVQRQVAADAEAAHTFVIAVDDPENASAYSGAIVDRPPMKIAISSSGAAPALTRLLKEILEYALPAEDWIEHARELRARWRTAGTPAGERFADLVRELAARPK